MCSETNYVDSSHQVVHTHALIILTLKCVFHLDDTLIKGFHKKEGPFVNSLEQALASFHVQRQAYYSGTFVGNHVHRALKVIL